MMPKKILYILQKTCEWQSWSIGLLCTGLLWIKYWPIPTLTHHSCHRENMSIFQGNFKGEKQRLWYQEMWLFVTTIYLTAYQPIHVVWCNKVGVLWTHCWADSWIFLGGVKGRGTSLGQRVSWGCVERKKNCFEIYEELRGGAWKEVRACLKETRAYKAPESPLRLPLHKEVVEKCLLNAIKY